MDLPKEDKSELYLNALDYAKENNLDINNIEDIKKILEALDPNQKEELNDFQYQLKNATFFLTLTSANKDK